jgi:hypothetical protein
MTNRFRTAVSIAALLAASIVSSAHGQAVNSAPAQIGAPAATWADAAKMPDFFTGMWMTRSPMTEADEKTNVPYTDAAQKYVDAYKPKRDLPYAQDGCLTPGLPIAMRSGPLKFAYAPGLIIIYMQGVGGTRFVRMNQPMGPTTPKYYGNSVGHWEGDTLVIESQDFLPEISFQYGVGEGLPPLNNVGTASTGPRPADAPSTRDLNLSRAIWGPHGENMHMVERLRLLDANTMEAKLTLYDDTVWKTPMVATTRKYYRIVKGVSERGPFSGEPEEWICTKSITDFDPVTNTYVDKDPEEMVKFLDKLGR